MRDTREVFKVTWGSVLLVAFLIYLAHFGGSYMRSQPQRTLPAPEIGEASPQDVALQHVTIEDGAKWSVRGNTEHSCELVLVTCTVVGQTSDGVSLSCDKWNDGEAFENKLAHWPKVWTEPRLGAQYHAARNGRNGALLMAIAVPVGLKQP